MAKITEVPTFRKWVGSDGLSPFMSAADRYHLYASLACPFAHQTVIVRKIKGLEKIIGMTLLDCVESEKGWKFSFTTPKCQLDTLNTCKWLSEIYKLASPGYDGAAPVPVLWDKETKTVVNNEPGDIMRMFNSEFNAFCEQSEQTKLNLYPSNFRDSINEISDFVIKNISNGVYDVGLAVTQDAYVQACYGLFESLEKVEKVLSNRRFLIGDHFTLADVRLFSTLIRFDWAYHGQFKCNMKRLTDFPNLWDFCRDVYNLFGIGETVDRDHIIQHYYCSHKMKRINPTGIYPIGPTLDFSVPNERRQKFLVQLIKK